MTQTEEKYLTKQQHKQPNKKKRGATTNKKKEKNITTQHTTWKSPFALNKTTRRNKTKSITVHKNRTQWNNQHYRIIKGNHR